MKRQIKLIAKYLKSHSKPNFNHFAKIHERTIEDISVKLLSNGKAITLERGWAKAYNDFVVILRPGKPLVGK
jgi:hypothetical protein